MKKAMSLVLAVMILLSLSACGRNSPVTNNDTGNSTTPNQTDATDTSSIKQNTDTASSNNSGNSSEMDTPSSTTSISTHTHSYYGATCTTPAKCSCGEINGSELGHNYSDGVCSRCGGIDNDYVEHISFHDVYLENYIKLELGIDGKHDISTQDMCNLKEIEIREHVADIQDLKYAVNLRIIRICASNIKNLNVLCTLPKINEIYIDHQISIDVSFMKNMRNIEKVYYNTSAIINAGSINDIFSSPVLKIVALDTFDSQITSVNFLKDISSIEEVHILGALSENCDFVPLYTLPNLNKLSLMCFVTSAQEKVIHDLMNNGVLISGQWSLK